MNAPLRPLLPTPAPRDEPDGTTAWSDEVGLPGPPRLLAWTVVQDDGATFDIHVLWDTKDLTEAMVAAVRHAEDFFRHNMSGGVVMATLNSADNAVRERFTAGGLLLAPRHSSEASDDEDEHDGSLGPVELDCEALGRLKRDVDAWLHADGTITIEVCEWGEEIEQLDPSGEIEYFYEVIPPMVPRFMALAGLDGADLLASLAEKWSGRYEELCVILEDQLEIARQEMMP